MTDTPPPFDALWFKMVVGFVVGLTLGSFVTMLSYRLPRRASIIKPNSYCPSCNAPLSPRELVPVVSWVIQRGKCRSCGTAIGARYILIEIILALAVMLAFLIFGFTFLLLLPVLVIVAVITIITIWLER